MSEPASESTSPGGRFVVQRHRARRLHYDLRLELGGVLVSWAVPKGPTLDPKVKSLAVHVDDHELSHFDFEGVDSAGDKIVWDWGTWRHARDGDPAEALAAGELHFDLEGEKLAGRFVLIHTKRGNPQDWLLVHKNDEHARPGWNPEDHPRSVKTGRTNDEL
jgi:bifunctional non-homologous end joining protein LigD